MMAPHLTMGRTLTDTFVDIESAQLIVVWGANPATDSPPLDMNRPSKRPPAGTRRSW